MELNNKKDLTRLREEIDMHLKPLADQFNLTIKAGGAKFESNGEYCDFKLTLTRQGKPGEIVGKAAADFKSCADALGLKPTDLGREFTDSDQQYRITGAKPGSVKYPILAVRLEHGVDGKTYKLPAERVLRALLRGEGKGKPHFHLERRFCWARTEDYTPYLDGGAFATAADAHAHIVTIKDTTYSYRVFDGCTCAAFAAKAKKEADRATA